MKVKVYPGPLCNTEELNSDGFLELNDKSTVNDVLKKLKYPIPLRIMGLYMVNYKPAKLSAKLKDGDIISVFTPLSGG
ncbi:MAG: ThiS family [Bacillota bacterium]|nr:ThiS family [Bacillota bacterium]